MAIQKNVIWTEGMFLKPQHMQQHDRYIDDQLRSRVRLLSRFGWGLKSLIIDTQLLKLGTIAVKHCEGVMPDGSLFSVDSSAGDRLMLEINETQQDSRVYLTLPVVLSGCDEVDLENAQQSLTRYKKHEIEVKDYSAGQQKLAKVNTAVLNLKVMLEDDITADYTRIPILHLREVGADGSIILDDSFVPPIIDYKASDELDLLLKEVIGLLKHRSETIANRLTNSAVKGTSEVADFMLLQTVNRYEATLTHFAQSQNIHPEQLFLQLLELAAELATFTHKAKRLGSRPAYEHNNLQETFARLMGELRQALSMVFEQSAIELPLQSRKYGVQVAPIADRKLLDDAQFIFALKSDWPKDVVIQKVPTMVKAGGVEQLRELVNLQLPGIQFIPMSVAPRQIPFHAGFTYFQLEKTAENWSHLRKSGGFAFHFSGDIPGLELELWAVKE